jgi:hypothetical protein
MSTSLCDRRKSFRALLAVVPGKATHDLLEHPESPPVLKAGVDGAG